MSLGGALPQLRAALCRRLGSRNLSLVSPPVPSKSTATLWPRHIPSLATSTSLLARLAFSSSNDSLETISQTQKQNQASADPDYVSIQEMKGLIERYDLGDMDAIPSILEAVLKRKLVQTKNNLESDPDLEQLLQGRRLDMESDGWDSTMEDENLDDDEEETDLDSDWTSDEEK